MILDTYALRGEPQEGAAGPCLGPARRALALAQGPEPGLHHVLRDGLQPGLLIARACSGFQPPTASSAAASQAACLRLATEASFPVAAQRALTCRNAICSASTLRIAGQPQATTRIVGPPSPQHENHVSPLAACSGRRQSGSSSANACCMSFAITGQTLFRPVCISCAIWAS